ncbi:MAG: hypothetical protein R2822_12070 [Spirosomataceae bacterium]
MSSKIQGSWQCIYQLPLFVIPFLISCVNQQDTSTNKVAILWKNGQPIGLSIPLHYSPSITQK